MTIYGCNGGVVVGQPISPFFGAQNGASPAGGPIISQPTTGPVPGGMQATGVQMSMMEAMSRGLMPMNALVNTVSGVSVGGAVSVIGSDPATVAQTFSNGNGQETCRGTAIAGQANNPVLINTGALSQQIFVDGINTANAGLSTGPTPTDISSMVEAPAPGSITTNNVALIAQQFGG